MLELILRTILTIFITFILTLTTEIVLRPRVIYSLTSISFPGTEAVKISLNNKSRKFQNDIMFLISDSGNYEIHSDNYLKYQITKSNVDTTKSVLRINELLPRNNAVLYIDGLENNANVTFIKNSSSRFVSEENLINRQLNIWQVPVIYSIILILTLGFFYFYINRMLIAARSEFDELKNDSRIIKADLEKEKAKILHKAKVIDAFNTKQRLILLAAIRDYKTELEFWQTVVSRILLQDKTMSPKGLFNQITETLKTYGVKNLSRKDLTLAEYLSKIISKETETDSHDIAMDIDT